MRNGRAGCVAAPGAITYANPCWTYAFSDWLGTKRAQLSADGNLANLSTSASLPVGNMLIVSGADATEHHSTGKERDTESGFSSGVTGTAESVILFVFVTFVSTAALLTVAVG